MIFPKLNRGQWKRDVWGLLWFIVLLVCLYVPARHSGAQILPPDVPVHRYQRQVLSARVQPMTVEISPSTVPEGRDFATRVLGDPWDMEQYSDVSKNLNESGIAIHLQNIQVANGIFSAQSADDAQFFTLFPGYQSAIEAGKDGARYPIDSSTYHCFYTRMRVNTSDAMFVFWYADEMLNASTYGRTIPLNTVDAEWKVYTADFTLLSYIGPEHTAWSAMTAWQGLRIDPTPQAGVGFDVDWVRLTDCQPVLTTVSWIPTADMVELWAGIGSPSPDFQVESSLSGTAGEYDLDVQGWEPGSYYLGIKTSSGWQWSAEPLQIDPSPHVVFHRPSFSSGESLSWEMNSAEELTDARCVDYTFEGGILNMITQSPNVLSSECSRGGISDPQLDFTLPISQVDTILYRYLTLRVHTEGEWQDVNNGWMMRWIWKTYENGDPSKLCYNVTNDIPFDVGWETLTLDLHDSFAGYTEDYAGGSFCHPRNWWDDPTDFLRLDPNENTKSFPLYQKLDWVRLSRMDRVPQGELYPIQLRLSETLGNGAFTFYYTYDRSVPRQYVAVIKDYSSETSSPLPSKLYLPLVMSHWLSSEITFQWDTTTVSPGEYFICVDVDDGLNESLLCSEAPVEVY